MWPHKNNLDCCLHCSEQQGDNGVPPRLPAENCAAAAAALQDTFATPSSSLSKQDKQKEHPAAQPRVIPQKY